MDIIKRFIPDDLVIDLTEDGLDEENTGLENPEQTSIVKLDPDAGTGDSVPLSENSPLPNLKVEDLSDGGIFASTQAFEDFLGYCILLNPSNSMLSSE